MKIYATIPARGGSKGVPGKNIINLGGYPLIAYSISAAKLVPCIDRIIVSTDSEEIASIAKTYGAEVPFLRPAAISQDLSTDLEWYMHFIDWLKSTEGVLPDLCIHLRPTTPLRVPAVISQAVDSFINNSNATSLRSAHESSQPPQKVFSINEEGCFKGYFSDITNPNLPRQMFAKSYSPNGYVDIIKTEYVLKNNLFHGDRILAFITSFTGDIDIHEDSEYLQYVLDKHGSPIHDYLINNFPKN